MEVDYTKTWAFAQAVDPEIMRVDPHAASARGTKQAWSVIKQNDAVRGTDAKLLRVELNRLLQEHFDLKQWARSCENRINECVGQIHLHEKRLAGALAEKKTALADENLLMERLVERTILGIENDVASYTKKLSDLKAENSNCLARLRAFNRERIQELKAILDVPPKPITK